MIETKLKDVWLSRFCGLPIFLLGSLSCKSLLFGLSVFGRVLLENIEELFFYVWLVVRLSLSRVLVNWAINPGTLILVIRILFCLCSWMYLGHLTNLVRSLLGRTWPPILKLLGLLSKRGLVTFWLFLIFLPCLLGAACVRSVLPWMVMIN